MDTLIVQVDCRPRNRDRPPQLGITVEAPYQQRQHQTSNNGNNNHGQQQQAAKDYRSHDYQNFEFPPVTKNQTNGTDALLKLEKISNGTIHNSSNGINNVIINNGISKHASKHAREPTQRGLQITDIQRGSIIDLNGQFRIGDIIVEVNGVNLQNRSFQEAQRTLREFVIQQSSHGPLQLKLLRKVASASSASLHSNTGSQSTIIEKANYTKQITPQQSPKRKTNGTSPIIEKPSSPASPRHLVGALNTRKIGTIHNIKLTKSADGGFGIKIAERDNMFGANRPIYITAITTTGSAYRDGRLKEGDMLLEVGGVDLSGKSQPEITRMLKGVAVNETVEFVVSRPRVDDLPSSNGISDKTDTSNDDPITQEEDKSLIDLNYGDHEHDDLMIMKLDYQQPEKKLDNQLPEVRLHKIMNLLSEVGLGCFTFNIPLNDTKSAGLGLYLKYLSFNNQDLGIWIEKVITGGAAWKDGRLQPNDQILAINGLSFVGLTNSEASETLTAAVTRGIGPEATANSILLKIHRRDPNVVAKVLHGIEISDSELINNVNHKPSSSVRSWDEESIDSKTGEERFKRDGFGRQSISEKRHAQLMASNTDTFRRNQKMREEREMEKQRHIKDSSGKVNVDVYVQHSTARVARNGSYRAAVDRSSFHR